MKTTHPTRRIGWHNKHILDHLAAAYSAALALADNGYTLLDIHIDARRPKIRIQHNARCRRLGGGLRMIDNTGPRRQHIIATHYKGAQIEWTKPA